MDKLISPCTGLCEMNTKSGYCKGCVRTIEEIMNWQKYTNLQRISIMKQLETRQKNVKS
ncbi:MAG: DUF1289 domain-containing protein [Planctomycetota bacterium]